MIPYVPKGEPGTMKGLLLIGVLAIFGFSMLRNIYILIFCPQQRRFRKLVSKVEWSLFGFGETDYGNSRGEISELKSLIDEKNSDNLQSEKDSYASRRRFTDLLRERS